MNDLVSNDTVTKNELSEALFDQVGLNKREAKDMIDAFFDLMISLLGTLAEHERAIIRERCKGGIEIAKSNGVYLGRKKGTVDDRNRTLKKHQDILTCLKAKMKIADICRLTGKHRTTVYKVKALL